MTIALDRERGIVFKQTFQPFEHRTGVQLARLLEQALLTECPEKRQTVTLATAEQIENLVHGEPTPLELRLAMRFDHIHLNSPPVVRRDCILGAPPYNGAEGTQSELLLEWLSTPGITFLTTRPFGSLFRHNVDTPMRYGRPRSAGRAFQGDPYRPLAAERHARGLQDLVADRFAEYRIARRKVKIPGPLALFDRSQEPDGIRL